MNQHKMPETLAVLHREHTHYFELHSYNGGSVFGLPHGVGLSESPPTHAFSRTTGKVQSAWGGGLEGAKLAPETLERVHPAAFALDQVKHQAE